eukprot:gb/GFBE01046740.1/.p1 GENE.gb/GFBE01046740.1/~~gb/GFBE01046740.1/.p1  ORF type:complete len:231 (+),score=66.61 gb/GFBE01046740.1/:1-693(+)
MDGEFPASTSLEALRGGPDEGRAAAPVPLMGALLPVSSDRSTSSSFQLLAREGSASTGDSPLEEPLSKEDFGGCFAVLMKELGFSEEKELLPLLTGVLEEVAKSEFSGETGSAGARKRGAFSRAASEVKVEDSAEQKVSDAEAFRRLRRAALPSDAAKLLRHKLDDDWCDKSGRLNIESPEEVPGLELMLMRFGFKEGKEGLADMRKALTEEHPLREGAVQEVSEEPCGF